MPLYFFKSFFCFLLRTYVYVCILNMWFLLSLCLLHFQIFFLSVVPEENKFFFFSSSSLLFIMLLLDVFFFTKWIKMMAMRRLSQNKRDKILACHFIKISRRRTRVNHLLEVETVVKQETNESRRVAHLINECGKLKILRPIFFNQDFFRILCLLILMHIRC